MFWDAYSTCTVTYEKQNQIVRRQESIAYEIYRGNRYLLQFWLSDLHMKNGTKICDTKPEVKINRIPLHGIDIAHKLHVLLGGDMLSSVG